MERGNGGGVEARQCRVTTPQSKQANVKRILKRALCEATEQTGARRLVGVFLVTISDGGDAGLGFALTAEEAPLAARAVEAGLERALGLVRAAATKPLV